MNSPRNAQTEAINAAIDDLGGLTKFGAQDQIRALRDLLKVDELPEKIMAARQDTPDLCLLIVTNHRLMLLGEKGFSRKIALLWDFPWDKITSVEYTPGMFWHRITVRQGRKKKSFHNMWGGRASKQFEARKMAEYLRERIGDHTSVAKDEKTAKANRIEDAVRSLVDLSDMGGTFGIGANLKELPKILANDELPELLMHATYDDRDGLRISSAMNRMGALVATDRRLIFIDKEPLRSVKVDSFPYHDISRVESSEGMLRGKVMIEVSGRTGIFEGDNQGVQRLAKHLQSKTPNPTATPTESEAELAKDDTHMQGFTEALADIKSREELLNVMEQKLLPKILEDDEIPVEIAISGKSFVQTLLLVATDRRIISSRVDTKDNLQVESFSYDTISDVEASKGLLGCNLIIRVSGLDEKFGNMTQEDVRKFYEHLRAKIAG